MTKEEFKKAWTDAYSKEGMELHILFFGDDNNVLLVLEGPGQMYRWGYTTQVREYYPSLSNFDKRYLTDMVVTKTSGQLIYEIDSQNLGEEVMAKVKAKFL
jgi:hypothetical protein